MLRLPLRALQSRETNRLPADAINNKLGVKDLPLERGDLVRIDPSPAKFVIYYGSAFYGEIPFDQKPREGRHSKGTFLLVRVDGGQEQVIDEGEIETDLKVYIDFGQPNHSHFVARGKLLGRYCFRCSLP